jgi:hypothetical protein
METNSAKAQMEHNSTKADKIENMFTFNTRMWLDYCDENNDLLSLRFSRDEYVEKWSDWLLEKYGNKE